MKRISFWTVVLAMCSSWVSTAHAQTGFIPVFIDDFGTEGISNIFQDPNGRIQIQLTSTPGSAFKVVTDTGLGEAIFAQCTSGGTVDCTGVAGFADGGVDGVFGSGRISGVRGFSSNPNGIGVRGISPGGTGGHFETVSGNILVGRGSNVNRFRVDAAGNVFAASYNTGGADFAESVQPAGRKDGYEAGDVLAIDQTAVRRVALARQPYSTLVAGIYSTKAGILASQYHMDDPRLAKEIPLAIVGIVPCKVSTENGPIKAGDLLVTSSTPGYAMKGTDRSRMLGAVVGKALEPVASGKSVIQVLVTLQ